MNSLQTELRRLYFPRPAAGAATDAPPGALIDAAGTVRCMVMELTDPGAWRALSAVWQGVQAELDLPAPAIAVSGTDGLQLWFSLAEPVTVQRAHAFLASLQARYLPDVAAARVHLLPMADGTRPGGARHAPLVPALQAQDGNWSAFVAADLAPVFDDSPWLDLPPNEDGQATLLRGLATIKPAAFEAATLQLTPAAVVAPEPSAAPPRPAAADDAPRRFLLQVMHDETAPLALRIEAAKALL